MECEVCCEKFTKLVRRKVQCPFCAHCACSMCSQKYLLDTTETAHCMNCRKAWSRLFLVNQFTKVFVNKTYRSAREDILYDLEKAMFQQTMPYVEHWKKCKKNEKIVQENLNIIASLRQNIAAIGYIENIDQKRTYCDMMVEINRISLENEYMLFENGARKVNKEDHRKFIKPCPQNGCKGFLSTQWKCELCEKHTCPTCHEPKETEHTCNPDHVKSVEMLSKDSKPCPKCGVLIFKIEGCDQMYCTSCHTAFSWRTGRVEIGRIHNPHYYDYQRRQGTIERETGDVQCGGMPQLHTLLDRLSCIGIYPMERSFVSYFHRCILEFEQYTLPRYNIGTVTPFDANREIRVQLIIGHINDNVFKGELYRRDKDKNRRSELGMVSTTFVQIMSDVFNRLLNIKTHGEYMTIRKELKEAIKYINSLFYDISIAYECTCPFIEDGGYITTRTYKNFRLAAAEQGVV